jgi:hypothetical protein
MSDHQAERDKQRTTARNKDQDSDRQGKLPIGRTPESATAKVSAHRPNSAEARKTFSQRQAEGQFSKVQLPVVERSAVRDHEERSHESPGRSPSGKPRKSAHPSVQEPTKPTFSQKLALGDRLLGTKPKPARERDRERER